MPGWGYQVSAGRVLREAAELGLTAMEAGPDGFLPPDPADMRRLLSDHGLGLVGGFVPAVLHRPELRAREMSSVERQAKLLAVAGSEVLVLAASTGLADYEVGVELDEEEWGALFESVALVEGIGGRYGLTVVVHPHYGTAIERPAQIARFLEGCETLLCLDTGHVMVGGGDAAEVAESAAERVGHVHLKDVDRELAESVVVGETGYEDAVRRGMYRPLGEGDVDVGRVLGALDGAGYGGWYVLEQDVMLQGEPEIGGGPRDEVKRSLAHLSVAMN